MVLISRLKWTADPKLSVAVETASSSMGCSCGSVEKMFVVSDTYYGRAS